MFPVHMCLELETAFVSQHIFHQLELFRQEWCFPCVHALEASTYINNLNFSGRSGVFPVHMHYTIRKMDLIIRSIERMLQTQLSMACRFKLQMLRRYNVKFSKMRNFTLDMLRLDKLKSTGGRQINIP
jgi:hypothetical protein